MDYIANAWFRGGWNSSSRYPRVNLKENPLKRIEITPIVSGFFTLDVLKILRWLQKCSLRINVPNANALSKIKVWFWKICGIWNKTLMTFCMKMHNFRKWKIYIIFFVKLQILKKIAYWKISLNWFFSYNFQADSNSQLCNSKRTRCEHWDEDWLHRIRMIFIAPAKNDLLGNTVLKGRW